MKKKAHIIAHSHWDREWYTSFEKHRIKLVELIDQLIETIDTDPNYGTFHLDGQIVPLEDYLEIKPHQRGKLEQLVRDGKLIIGPWYILQDEFLISSEANVRNLQIGIAESKAYGPYGAIGYFPDSFGNIGQAPQILQQAGITCAVYGRGVRAVGFNNEVVEEHTPHTSNYSEMYWESPDGSRVLAVLFANWYHNGMEIPADPKLALAYWNERLPKVEAFASTPELLFMNGCDHQPLQRDLTEAIAVANKVRPDVEFVHSSFPEYMEALRSSVPQNLSVVKGELRSQWTDGWNTLVNTASARVYIKQENNKSQVLLEKVAEPLAVMAYAAGQPYPEYELLYAWKTLLRNHPHDSICGCSVDEVHQEMMTRFQKSQQTALAVAERSTAWLVRQIDTAAFRGAKGIPQLSAPQPKAVPFVVFNTTGHVRSGVLTASLHVSRHYFDGVRAPHDQHAALAGYDPGELAIIDADGKRVEAVIAKKGLVFGYDLPDDRFRQPYWAYEVEVTLYADRLPALGYATFAVVGAEEAVQSQGHALIVQESGRILENGLVKIEIHEDGSFDAIDKTTGRAYRKLGIYEDTGDLGNEYMYKQPDGELAITSEGVAATLQVIENSGLRGCVQLTQTLMLPVSADETLDKEIQSMTPFRIRKAQRMAEKRAVRITTTITLEQHDRGVKIESEIDNTVLDHRIRMLFPTELQTDSVTVDSIYELASRPIKPEKEWINPSNAQHQQAFVSLSDGTSGVTVANKGLHEYEVLQDEKRTIAVTLLRGTRELGDWGVFPTPEAQCLGLSRTELKVIFHVKDVLASQAYVDAYQFQAPWTSSATDVHAGELPARADILPWSGDGLAVTACKVNAANGDIMLRLFNAGERQASVSLQASDYVDGFYKSNILEETALPAEAVNGITEMAVRGGEIVTVGMKRKS